MENKSVSLKSRVVYDGEKYSHFVEVDSLRELLKEVAENNPNASVFDFSDHITLHLTIIKNRRIKELKNSIK